MLDNDIPQGVRKGGVQQLPVVTYRNAQIIVAQSDKGVATAHGYTIVVKVHSNQFRVRNTDQEKRCTPVDDVKAQ